MQTHSQGLRRRPQELEMFLLRHQNRLLIRKSIVTATKERRGLIMQALFLLKRMVHKPYQHRLSSHRSNSIFLSIAWQIFYQLSSQGLIASHQLIALAKMQKITKPSHWSKRFLLRRSRVSRMFCPTQIAEASQTQWANISQELHPKTQIYFTKQSKPILPRQSITSSEMRSLHQTSLP